MHFHSHSQLQSTNWSSSTHRLEESSISRQLFCGNCGKNGHAIYQCKNPITSCGVILFRIQDRNIQYLMIRRRDTLGYVDFLRGKYSIKNKKYIKSLLIQMTEDEIQRIQNRSFDELWNELWNVKEIEVGVEVEQVWRRPNTSWRMPPPPPPSPQHWKLHTTLTNRDKFNILREEQILYELIAECYREKAQEGGDATATNPFWNEPEWGFCKGRRNHKENDYDCALREMEEETGYDRKKLKLIRNVHPFVELFMSSNHKCYKHKYYLMYMDYIDSLKLGNFDRGEVSCIQWLSYKECCENIRPYNVMKKKILTNVHNCLTKYVIYKEDM
jgi:8-oxo-dGTP pyrophosphatase MutT (NUDIX family)